MLQGRGCIAVVLEIFVCLFNFAINASSKIINLNCSLGCNFFLAMVNMLNKRIL